MFAPFALVTLLSTVVVQAAVVPVTPGPGSIFNEGGPCTVSWQGDPESPFWGTMALQLMSGDNLNMIHLTTITTELDGSVDGQFDFTCPDVSPNSAIYFYQFTTPLDPEKTWTTRFTIAGADGSTVPPENPVQGDGEPIPWGVGALADPSTSVPPPPNGTPTGSGGNSTLTTSRPTTSATRTLTPTSSSRTTRPSSSAGANATGTAGANANGAVGMVDTWKMGVMVAASVFALAFAL